MITKRFYLQLDQENIIRDCIEYPHEGYIEHKTTFPLPVGLIGGWWKLENGQFVEYPELKPVDKDAEIENLKQAIAELTILIAGGA